jgi:translation elongation factor EF-1alpha
MFISLDAGKKTIMKIVEEESTKCRFITNAEGHDISMTGVLVVSANDDEFESSIGNGRILQILTRIKRETQEIKCILVLLNKLDDPTVQWDEKRLVKTNKKIIGSF